MLFVQFVVCSKTYWQKKKKKVGGIFELHTKIWSSRGKWCFVFGRKVSWWWTIKVFTTSLFLIQHVLKILKVVKDAVQGWQELTETFCFSKGFGGGEGKGLPGFRVLPFLSRVTGILNIFEPLWTTVWENVNHFIGFKNILKMRSFEPLCPWTVEMIY